MSKLFNTLVLASAVSMALLSGCAGKNCCDDKEAATKAGAANVAIVNTMCPIGGDEFDSKEHPATLTRTVEGKAIGFCCEGCTKKFDKMTTEKQHEVLTAANANKKL